MSRLPTCLALLALLSSCTGNGGNECSPNDNAFCPPDKVCSSTCRDWCGFDRRPDDCHFVCLPPKTSCSVSGNCDPGTWCQCANPRGGTCCSLEGWAMGMCAPCEDDEHCGADCTPCGEGESCLEDTCTPVTEVNCGDGVDEDLDGHTDCDDDDCTCIRELRSTTILGEGGFFGISGVRVGSAIGADEGSFAIGGHYAETPGGVEAGRLYFFHNGSIPEDASDAALVLEAPDEAMWGGFGYALSGPCDFDHDGHLDLPVGSHLYGSRTTPNHGRVVVFWGDASGTLSTDRTSYHLLSPDLRARSDSMGQTVLCADFDGDGFDDLLSSGQNAGAADTGLAVIYPGGPGGLGETQDQVLEPKLLADQQYFGSSSLYEDLDGDGQRDLAVGGWQLIRGDLITGPRTGGVFVFAGGDDWSAGPSYGIFPAGSDPIQAGSGLAFFRAGGKEYLAVSAPDYGTPVTGAVFIYETGTAGFHLLPPAALLTPPEGLEDAGFPAGVGFVPDFFRAEAGALLVGAKYADTDTAVGAGAVVVYAPSGDGFEPIGEVLAAPDPVPNDGFGSAIVPLDDVTGDGLTDFFVGTVGGVDTGTHWTYGAVFYH